MCPNKLLIKFVTKFSNELRNEITNCKMISYTIIPTTEMKARRRELELYRELEDMGNDRIITKYKNYFDGLTAILTERYGKIDLFCRNFYRELQNVAKDRNGQFIQQHEYSKAYKFFEIYDGTNESVKGNDEKLTEVNKSFLGYKSTERIFINLGDKNILLRHAITYLTDDPPGCKMGIVEYGNKTSLYIFV